MATRPAGGSSDVVIVGAGHNGLVAATMLARAGRSVLVLERRDELGGAAVSAAVFPGVGVRVSRYAYLVSLFPAALARELGLDVELRRRRVSSYTPPATPGCWWTTTTPSRANRWRAPPATRARSPPGSASTRHRRRRAASVRRR